jgi:hypothetical protein
VSKSEQEKASERKRVCVCMSKRETEVVSKIGTKHGCIVYTDKSSKAGISIYTIKTSRKYVHEER